jgi:hypothetical protein
MNNADKGIVLLVVMVIGGIVLAVTGIITALEAYFLVGGPLAVLIGSALAPKGWKHNVSAEWKRLGTKDKTVYATVVLLAFLLLFSLPLSPFPPFSLFSPTESSTIIFPMNLPLKEVIISPNGTSSTPTNVTINAGIGRLTLSSKSGLSVGSPVEMTMVMFVNVTTMTTYSNFFPGYINMTIAPGLEKQLHFAPPTITFSPTDAYAYPSAYDTLGNPLFQNISLTYMRSGHFSKTPYDEWQGSGWVEFFVPGSWGYHLVLFGQKFTSEPIFNIGTADVTGSAINASLITSLTLAIILLAVLELRSKK